MLMLSLVRTSRRHDPVDAQSGNRDAGALASIPEPVVHDTGAFMFARVQAVENRIGMALCPTRLAHRLRSLIKSPVQR